MKVTPRPYQAIATKAGVTGLRGRHKRALVVMATGLGKTLTSAFITKQMKSKRVLFLVHNNYILRQAVKEFRLVFDDSVQFAVFNGMSKKGAEQAQFVFATWQTMGKHLRRWVRAHFDLVIVDEAHHSEAATYRPVVEYFTGAKLGLTATPDRQDDADIRSIFGPEVVNISLEVAIARGWLPRVEYHVVTDESLDDAALQQIVTEIRQGHRRFTMAEVNRRLFIRKRDHQIAKIIDGYNEKAGVFCASIVHAERMSRSLKLAETFHSGTGKGHADTWKKNHAALTALKNGTIRRICTVNAFNEGVDVPSLGLVAFCRVTDSPTIFRQQLGRGLRPGKEKLIVLDFVGNLERIQLVLDMMNAVSDEHERSTTEGERVREGYERKSFEVSGHGFEFTFSDQVVDLMKVLEHVEREFYPIWEEAGQAAVKLGIRKKDDYAKAYRKDPKLPSAPQTHYPAFPNWPSFLGRQTRNLYPTWQEASRAAIKLGFKKSGDYQAGRHLDPRLPSTPRECYPDYPGDTVFFGRRVKNLYKTWKQASRAARRLKLTSFLSYLKGHKRDPRLPSNPTEYYVNLSGWSEFFGRERKCFYATMSEASRVAIQLKLHTFQEYQKGYRKDPLLPSAPNLLYSDFPGWRNFLGRPKQPLYPSWQQAGKVVRKMKIRTSAEYKKGANKRDPRLPSNPQKTYKDFPGWSVFLGKKR